jgi:hypothetical protein
MTIRCDVCYSATAANGDLLCPACRERQGSDNPIRVSEIRRLVALAGLNGERGVPPVARESAKTKRKREFDQAIAEARATLDEIHALPSADPPTPAPKVGNALPTSDVAAIVAAELDRRAAAERDAATAADAARYRCPTGGCWRCGVSEMQYTTGEPADWFPDGDGRHLCPPCKQISVDRPFLDDDERRLLDITMLLGLSNATSATWPMRPASDFNRIPGVLFAEIDAEPSLVPWAHVNVEALREAYEAVVRSSTWPKPLESWPTRKGPECPTCGNDDYLVTDGMPVSHWPIEGAEQATAGGRQEYRERMERSECATCRQAWLASA